MTASTKISFPGLLIVLGILIAAVQISWARPVPGSLPAHWLDGAEDCETASEPPLQVHAYEPQTFILRQSPCVDFEANFVYLLIGSERALLIDTGAIADPARVPLAETVLEQLPEQPGGRLPLLVVHTHGHADHDGGDAQFEGLPSVKIVPAELSQLQAFFGFADWPRDTASLDLGGRIVVVIPTLGHHSTHLVFYDARTGLLFSGDFLLPGRLLIGDAEVYRDSALRVADFLSSRPLTHILGGHIELDGAGRPFPFGSEHHPGERPLEMTRQDLLAVPAALAEFNGFYARHETFILVDPIHNLMAMATAVLVVLIAVVWGVRRFLRARRRST